MPCQISKLIERPAKVLQYRHKLQALFNKQQSHKNIHSSWMSMSMIKCSCSSIFLVVFYSTPYGWSLLFLLTALYRFVSYLCAPFFDRFFSLFMVTKLVLAGSACYPRIGIYKYSWIRILEIWCDKKIEQKLIKKRVSSVKKICFKQKC